MKTLRIVLASLSLLTMAAVFTLPVVAASRFVGFLPRLQLVPALLAGSAFYLAIIAVLTALFGRAYCAVICPLGIAQDLVRSIARLLHVPAVRAPKMDFLRLLLLALFVVALVIGVAGVIEPYAIFGRFLSAGVMRFAEPEATAVAWSLGLFGVIVLFAAVVPRLWCNAICPVGTFLGVLSRFSLFRVRIDRSKCVNCNLCVKACEQGCISAGNDKTVDHSRCVDCLACGGVCRKGAIKWH